MDPSLTDLAPHFSCALDRADILETPPVGDTALASQKCVLCGRAFPNKAARLCNSCSNK